MTPPHLTFYCELGERELTHLFANAAVEIDLAALAASVSLACLDSAPGRAEVVRRLNRLGVAVCAWLVVPREAGYFATADNALLLAARFDELCAWAARERIAFEAIGIDVEMDIADMENLVSAPWRLIVPALRGALRPGRARRAEAQYGALIARIRAAGYRVETYQVPPVVDGRAARSTLMARAFGMLDLRGDREVLMLYSSALPLGAGWLASYARGATAIGVGVTGGGTVTVPRMSWDDLARDLRIAGRAAREVYVFSLEGCVERGWLDRLIAFDWDAPVAPTRATRLLDTLRGFLRAGLWLDGVAGRALGALDKHTRR